MIYGNSTHPILIKKVSLLIWSLKDEIKSILKEKLGDTPDGDISIQQINQALKEYQGPQAIVSAPPPEEPPEEKSSEEESEEDETPKEAEELDDSEDEMMKALAEDQKNESGELDDSEDEMAKALAEAENEESDEENSSDKSSRTEFSLRKRPPLDDEKMATGICVLSEITMDKIYFFSEHYYMPGRNIVLEFQVPKSFIISAEVVTVQNYNYTTRIISSTRPSYRLCAHFTFNQEGERTTLREFIKSIEPDLSKYIIKKAAVAEDEDDEDDDFGDLDF